MSLINDALRRAGQKKQSPIEHSGGAPMRPVEPSAKNSNSLLPIFIIVLFAVALGTAGWFFWLALRVEAKSIAATKTEKPSTAPEIISTTPNISISLNETESKPAIAPVAETKSVGQNESAIAVNPETNPSPAAVLPSPSLLPSDVASATPAATTLASPPPTLKLQGIFYRPSKSTALVNGEMVGVGDAISGARIVSITAREVTVQWNKHQIVLKSGRSDR